MARVNMAAFDRVNRLIDRAIGSVSLIDGKTRKLKNATFCQIKPIVPGFVRIGLPFEQSGDHCLHSPERHFDFSCFLMMSFVHSSIPSVINYDNVQQFSF